MKNLILCLMVYCVSAFSFAAEQDKSMPVDNEAPTMADVVIVSDAWARATFALAKTGASYMYISNDSANIVTLSEVKVSETLASDAQLHHTTMQDDMMQMRELTQGVSVNAGQTIAFQPGGMHVMIMGLVGPLEPEQTFSLTLVFADGSEKTTKVSVKDARFNKSMSLDAFSKGASVVSKTQQKGMNHE